MTVVNEKLNESDLTALLCAAKGDDFKLQEAILDLFKAKMKQDYEYINPNFMQSVLRAIDDYYNLEDCEVDKWVMDMFGV